MENGKLPFFHPPIPPQEQPNHARQANNAKGRTLSGYAGGSTSLKVLYKGHDKVENRVEKGMGKGKSPYFHPISKKGERGGNIGGALATPLYFHSFPDCLEYTGVENGKWKIYIYKPFFHLSTPHFLQDLAIVIVTGGAENWWKLGWKKENFPNFHPPHHGFFRLTMPLESRSSFSCKASSM